MRLRLKEDPREWLKFAIAWSLVLGALTVLLWLRHVISRGVLTLTLLVLASTLTLCMFRRNLLRQPYRWIMTASFFIGQIIGGLLILIIFLLVLTPLGLLLRLAGKDLLGLKRNTSATTHWHPAKETGQLETQF
jgi:O-antigen/teichoic acid export membrane protein